MTSAKKIFSLYDACGDHDHDVTEDLLKEYGVEYTVDNGDLIPLSKREIDIFTTDKGYFLQNNSFIRWVRFYLIDGVKYMSIGDDDYHSPTCDRFDEYCKNKVNSTFMFNRIANALELKLETSLYNASKEQHNEYDFEIKIPLSFFDFVSSKKDLEDFFIKCAFEDKADLAPYL